MVQRKLNLQTQTISLSLSHHHDLKSPRGADLKAKKMKKSGPIKRPKQPGKPPPPATKTGATPNYMKSTTSSDARKESKSSKKAMKTVARTLTKNPSFKPVRAAAVVRKCGPVVICENLDAQRATCSSTLKDCKFPAYLSLNPGGTESAGTSAIKVCPYTYCSLNGHHHAPLPPLKCFLSARRRAIKTQRSVKLGCLSPSRVGAVGDDDFNEKKNKDLFVQIYTADDFDEETRSGQNQEVSVENESPNDHFYDQDSSDGSEMNWETGYCSPLQLDYDYECDVEPDPEADVGNNQIIKDEFIVNSDGQESFDEEGFNSDAFSSSDDGESTGLYDDDLKISSTVKTSEPLQVFVEGCTDPQTGNQDHEASSDNLNHEYLPDEEAVAVTGDESSEAERRIFSKAKGENAATADIALRHFTSNSKKLNQDGDDLGAFNPRAPNFLPLEPDPEAQKVDLRHQDLDERKNAEEWMVDYALRQVVTKLGPARKRKVSLLVEAFEKVMPATKYDLHGSAFDQARPIQACS